MKFLLFILLCSNAFAGFQRKGDEVLPFKDKAYPLTSLIEDYSSITGRPVSYEEDIFRKNQNVHVELNTSISLKDFEKFFHSALDMSSFTAVNENGVLWIYNSRDVRYLPIEVYTDESYPKDKTYSTVMIELKHPLSSNIARNLRTILSRYGRVIDFSNGNTILVNDLGTNIERIKQTISSMDTDEAFKRLVKMKPKTPKFENPLKEKLIDLQIENELLKKKCMKNREVKP
jgi:type II secretory pathway component GspD/PulD (secretin)